MSRIIKKSFDITKCQRLSQLNEKIIKQYERKTGASISIIVHTGQITTLTISGNSSQFIEAKVLMRDLLDKTSFIPAVCYFILADPVSDSKLKFVEFNEKIVEINDDDGDDDGGGDDSLDESSRITYYSIEFLQDYEADDNNYANRSENFLDLITPCKFNTFNKLNYCLERLSLKMKTTIKRSLAFPDDQIIFKPKIIFGKLLFYGITSPEDPFVLQEWYRFNALSRIINEIIDDYSHDDDKLYGGKMIYNEFRQGSLLIKEKFKILQQKFGFKLDSEQNINKGKVTIFYVPAEFKKRRISLRLSEQENEWKVAIHAHSLNRLASIDIISGSKEPDFRLSLKSFYDLPSEGSGIEKTVNDVQSRISGERNGMWFQSKDFAGTTIKRAVVRQFIEKKRYKNEKYSITFSKVKQEERGNITFQNIVALKHRYWGQTISLDNVDEFMRSITETFHDVRKMMNALV
ncbi:hypothetical protein RhiirA4_506678 [Rhizophagus irregularis]|uniref:Uncharacterized protein n=1 Tax=Rhizophagus irregularis TaxID=588596 RepID=A0A2I1FV16_9GLOM|nr:hypothetical protein RhiirA4_506678 [Rhizophagus irregularis]